MTSSLIVFFFTFSSCPSVTGIRTLAAIACELGLDLGHFDAEQAFVQSELKKIVFIRLPQGYSALSGMVVMLIHPRQREGLEPWKDDA